MALSNAERQRAWRERHHTAPDNEPAKEVADPKAERDALAVALKRNAELEAEVRHLKVELARRPAAPILPRHQFNSQPFTPVPKK